MKLCSENPRVFRITHIENIPWILEHGMHCQNGRAIDRNFRAIGNDEIIERRRITPVPIPPGGHLSDYVPFYFTPRSMMMYNIVTGWSVPKVERNNIVIITTNFELMTSSGLSFVYTNAHAVTRRADFFNDSDGLSTIDWSILRLCDFRRDENDPDKTSRYMAECLVHEHVPLAAIEGIACYSENEVATLKQQAKALGVTIRAAAKPDWYL